MRVIFLKPFCSLFCVSSLEERRGERRNEERESVREICYNKDLSLRLNAAEEKAPFERESKRERE